MSSSPSPVERRRIAGRYAVRRKLGSGSFGAVYEVWDEAEGRPVALKVIRTEQLLANAVARMKAEFRAIASLRHRQIACAYDFGFTREDGIPYYTREYIEGMPLAAGPPRDESPEAFLRPVFDLLEALDHVHAQGVLHLDIHAGNLIVADDPRRGSVLIDFGLVRSLATFTGASQAWPALPPELAHGRAAVTQTDIFLVGRLLLWRLTGQTTGDPVLPGELAGWGTRVTLDLERIATRALHRQPEQRFSSARELRAAIESAVRGRPARAAGIEMRSGDEAAPRRLVGRDAELAAIDSTLDRANRGEIGLLGFAGPDGLGKTRLLGEARVKAQLRGLATVEVRFRDPDGPEPAFLAALRKLQTGREELLQWLEALSPTFGGSPEDRAARAASAYFSARETALALILDDLDHADRESLVLVDALVAECRRRDGPRCRGLALILTAGSLSRTEGLGRSARRLEPLDEPRSRQIVVATLAPLEADEEVIERVVALAAGSPLRLRQIAMALRDGWQQYRSIPADAAIPDVVAAMDADGAGIWHGLDAAERGVIELLALVSRATSLAELAAALELSPWRVGRLVRRLRKLEVISRTRDGRTSRFSVAASELHAFATVRPRLTRTYHRRLARFLERAEPTLSTRDALARHLLAAGEQRDGSRLALEVATELRRAGAYDRAIGLLRRALERERSARWRAAVVDAMSTTLAETGDDTKAIEILEPLLEAADPRPSRERVRLARCLGIHYHRAGSTEKARATFQALESIADESRDLEDLIFVDSELAELSIFQGDYAAAEASCSSGLERLSRFRGEPSFRGRMEVMLRASRGHIQLRKLDLEGARDEFVQALERSRVYGTLGDRASILHNLGVLESQANDFLAARDYFDESAQLLIRAGERQNLIKTSTNLALIEAKIGDRDAALEHVERASGLLRYHPGERLECFVKYSRATVLLLFGECEDARSSFLEVVDLAARMGDRPLTRFAELGLGEVELYTGRYTRALALFDRPATAPGEPLGPLFERMSSARSYLAEALLGRPRKAAQARKRVEETESTGLVYPESWNGLFVALADVLQGRPASAALGELRERFARLGVVAGERLAEIGLLLAALAGESHARDHDERSGPGGTPLSALVEVVAAGEPMAHRFVDVVRSVVLAAAWMRLDDAGRARERLNLAAGAIVGSPFLEVDWNLELLRARLSLASGEVRDARRHLHRCLHCRDLLAQQLPASSRRRFLAQPRFRQLNQAASRLKIQPVSTPSTRRLRESSVFDGMVGACASMRAVFDAIRKIRDQDVTVLITGETGTGKDLAARSIHARSLRSDQPFVVVSCACIPDELFESELFGYSAGAFTGAERDQPGLIESAEGGTVLLESVQQLSLESQARLLRLVERRTVRRLGSASTTRIDVRFIATSSDDLRALVEQGRFREDLYFRLAGIEIVKPALRERRDDMTILIQHVLGQHARHLDRGVARIDADAVELLSSHDWPGNVRELEAVLFRALIHVPPTRPISAGDIGPLLGARGKSIFARERSLLDRDLEEWHRELDREYLTRLFLALDGDTSAMMERLGVKSSKLYDWFRRAGVDVRELRRRLGS